MGQSGANEVFMSRVVTELVDDAGLDFAERGSVSSSGIFLTMRQCGHLRLSGLVSSRNA